MKNLGILETNWSVKLSLKVQFYVKVNTGGFEQHNVGTRRKYESKWVLRYFSPSFGNM